MEWSKRPFVEGGLSGSNRPIPVVQCDRGERLGPDPFADIAAELVFDPKGGDRGSVRFGGLALQRYEPLEVCDGAGDSQRQTVPNSLALGIERPVRSFGTQIRSR